MSYLVVKLFISIVLFAGCPSATVGQVNIHTEALRNNGSVCPGIISFTCETRGSFAIAWSSEQYIGAGGVQLLFAAGASVVGEFRRSGSGIQTVAILTYNAIENGEQVLISTLTITVAPNSHGGSVTCMHVGDGNIDSVNFEVIADPGVPRDVFAIQIEHIMDSCIVTTFWRRPDNTAGIINYEVKGYQTFANGTNLSNDTIFSGTSDDNEVASNLFLVPGCSVHYISVSAVNECDRAGPPSNEVMLIPEDRHRLPNTTSCNSGSKTNTGSFIMMIVMTMNCILVMLM